jgi:hypothetical protein
MSGLSRIIPIVGSIAAGLIALWFADKKNLTQTKTYILTAVIVIATYIAIRILLDPFPTE